MQIPLHVLPWNLKRHVALGQNEMFRNWNLQNKELIIERAVRTAGGHSTFPFLVSQASHEFHLPLWWYGFLASFLISSNCWWKLLQTTLLSLSDVLTETEIDMSSAII